MPEGPADALAPAVPAGVVSGEEARPGTVVPEPPRDSAREILTEGLGILERCMGEDADDILPRLITGDPLHLQESCARHIKRDCVLMDPQRLYEQALVEVAADASLCTMEDLHPDWIDDSIRRACQRTIFRDSEELLRGEFAPPEAGRFEYVYQAFCVPGGHGRVASVEFNALSFETRRTFFALLVEDLDPAEAMARGIGTEETMRYDIWECLRALQIVTEQEKEEFFEKLAKRQASEAKRAAEKEAAAELSGCEDNDMEDCDD